VPKAGELGFPVRARIEAQTLPGGTGKCVAALAPLGVGGVVILGQPPTRPRVALSGDSLVFSRRSFSDGLCLEGLAHADSIALVGPLWEVPGLSL
jgi:hypothetical protein